MTVQTAAIHSDPRRNRPVALAVFALATLAFLALSAAMPRAALAYSVNSSRCEITGVSAPKFNDTVASTGISNLTMTLTFDCTSASVGPCTIPYCTTPGSDNVITIDNLMWLDPDDGVMADDATFSVPGTYTLYITATMPQKQLGWPDTDPCP